MNQPNVSFAFKGSAMSIDDEFWRYSFGKWTLVPRLPGETDEQVFERIQAETERKLGWVDTHTSGAPSWDAMTLPTQES
jgi:hypothetical protein